MRKQPSTIRWGVGAVVLVQLVAAFWLLSWRRNNPTKWDVRYLEVQTRWDPGGRLREQLSHDNLRAALKSFLGVWKSRPTAGLTDINEQFALHAVVQSLAPQLIVEAKTGKKGMTWLLRQAAPTAKMFCFDPREEELDSNISTISITGASYVDMKDYPFEGITKGEKTRAVIVIDDEHHHLARLQDLTRAGFGGAWVIFTRNSAPHLGKVHTLKKLWDTTGSPKRPFELGSAQDEVNFHDGSGSKLHISLKQHLAMLEQLKSIVDAYVEFPPLVPVSWSHQAHVLDSYFPELADRITPTPLFASPAALNGFLRKEEQPVIDWPQQQYSWPALVHLA